MYAYSANRPESFPNLRVAAQAPWRGLTAIIQGQPYLVIDKDESTYTLEGESGDIIKLEQFVWDGTVTERDRLTAASRLANSPLRQTGTLFYDDEEGWLIISEDGKKFNVEAAIEYLESNRWFTSSLKHAALSGSFVHEMTGEEVTFHETNHYSADATVGAAEYWVVQGDDNSTYYVSETGLVLDEIDNIVGKFDPYADPDPDRYEYNEGWYEDWERPVAKVGKVYARSDHVNRDANLPFIYDPDNNDLYIGGPGDLHYDVLQSFPEALSAYSEGGWSDEYDAEHFTYAAAGYVRYRDGRLSTDFYNDEYAHLGDRVIQLAESEIEFGRYAKVAANSFSFRGNTGGTSGIAEGVAVRPDRQSKEDILRQVDAMPGHERDRARQRELIPEWAINRGGKVAAPFEPDPSAGGRGGQPVTYAPGVILVSKWVEPDQNWLLYHDRCVGIIAEAGGLTSHGVVVARERNIPIVVDAREAENIAPGDKVRLNGETGVIDVNGGGGEIDRMAPGQQASMGVTRFVWSLGNSMTAPIPQDDPESGKLHMEMLQELDAEGRLDWMDFAMGTVYEDGHADIVGEPSDREALNEFVRSLGATGELVEIADMAALASTEKVAAEGKYPAGTRVQLEHSKLKGQRGTILECGGKHKDLDEEQYKILLDSGEEVEDIMESHFKKIKSASFDPAEVDSVSNHFLDSMDVLDDKYSGDNEHSDYTVKGDDPVVCPNCGSHTVRAFGAPTSVGKAEMKCLTCGKEFKRDVYKNPEASVKNADFAELVQRERDESQGFKVGDVVELSEGRGRAQVVGPPEETRNGVFIPIEILDGNYKGTRVNITPGSLTKPGNFQKGSPYPGHHDDDKGSDKKHMKGAPEKVNEIYHACMREGNGSGDTKDEKQESCARIAWSTYKKMKGKDSSFDEITLEEAEQVLAYLEKEASPPEECPYCGAQYSGYSEGSNGELVCKRCGMDVNTGEQREDISPDLRADEFKAEWQRGSKVAVAADSNGNELQPGQWYVMHSTQYKVPDVIRILNIEDNRIEAAIEGDVKGHFPLAITNADIEKNGYSFEPYEEHDEPEEARISGWKISRRNFTPGQQRDLINENLSGRARNFDRLNLEGTHYPSQDSGDDIFVLW